MKGRTPTTSKKAHMNTVGAMPCIACEKDGYYNTYISLHHIESRTKLGAHFKVLPLCGPHHQHDDTDPMERIVIHPYNARFENRYGTSEELLGEIQLKIKGKKHGAY